MSEFIAYMGIVYVCDWRSRIRTVIPPFSLFRILVASFHIERIIRRSLLLATAAQHGGYAKADRLHRQRRRPVLRQDGQADVAIAVDMRMHWYVAANERDLGYTIKNISRVIYARKGQRACTHLGRIEGIFVVEFEQQLKVFALIKGALETFNIYFPSVIKYSFS